MSNFYIKFVPYYADITEPLRKLLRKDMPWSWENEQREAYTKIKNLLCAAPILAHFDPNAETFITMDASNLTLGAVLSQKQDGVEKPVAFASRALTPTEQKYSASEKESLACVWASEKWHFYLFGRAFTIRTDHKALTTLLETSGKGHRPLRLYRWSERLNQYKFKTVYMPGRENVVADLLSRAITAPAEVTSATNKKEEAFINEVLEAQTKNVITPAELLLATTADANLQRVIAYVHNGWPAKLRENEKPLKLFFNVKESLSLWNNGCLAKDFRSVIPAVLQEKILKMAHESHCGIVRTK